jgi:hypothetical protein
MSAPIVPLEGPTFFLDGTPDLAGYVEPDYAILVQAWRTDQPQEIYLNVGEVDKVIEWLQMVKEWYASKPSSA